MPVAAKFKESAEKSYAELVRLNKTHSGPTVSIMVHSDRFVPNALKGNFLITGKGVRHTATNLSRALVVLKSVRNANTVWLVGEDGKRSKVVWK